MHHSVIKFLIKVFAGQSVFDFLKDNNYNPYPVEQVWILHQVWSGGGRGPTEDIIHYFTLMSSELHYLDIIPKIENLTLMSSASGKITYLTPIFL